MRVLGRPDDGDAPAGHLGRYLARDGSTGGRVGVDLDRPHVVVVVGKRGYGKSYTLGVLGEELARAPAVAPVIADPMAVFGGLVDGTDSVDARPATVRPDALPPRAWCRLLGLPPQSAAGALLWQAAGAAETLAGMRTAIDEADAGPDARRAAANHLALADRWQVFDARSPPLAGDRGAVVDLSGVGGAATDAVVAAVAATLYERASADAGVHPWFVLDEAHAVIDGVASEPLERLATRGRQPGVSLVAATQRPGALPESLLSQADLLIAHRLTDERDREALAAVQPSYLSTSVAERMPTTTGDALVVDDTTESVHTVRVRERETPHGGDSPRASESKATSSRD